MFTPIPKPILKDLTQEETLELAKFLKDFFKDAPQKAILWILTKNPAFGGISPATLIGIGRGIKVLEFVRASKSENTPDE